MRLMLSPLLLITALWGACAAPLPIVQAGRSDYVIYHQADAPDSVKTAALDLQRYVQAVTGAKLALVNAPQPRMIGLGSSPAAVAQSLSAEKMPLESFRVVTRGSDVFILGPDTANDELTPQGGTTNGTANGVYAFIERFLGVRWLMPGPHGDYVPHAEALSIPDTDWSETPFFLNRRVPYTQERTPASKQWWARQRLGWSLFLSHSHNFRAIKPEAFTTHPEWFPEGGGVRVPPSGEYKLCLTNEGLIEAFAAAAIKAFDDNPQMTSFSLSPSDGGGWCQCAKCKALYETDPNGDLSVTPAVINFYNRVAEIVGRKYPDKVLAGYIYANYVYPPSKPFKLAPNMFLVWAPSFDYGFTLYRPDMQQRWEALVPQWLKVTDKIAYYDLPNCVHNELGAPNPPGLKILKFLYPRLKKANMKGVYVYGSPAWGYAGPMNYLLAKLAWNPDEDVDALFSEYVEKAYAEAAPEIKRFFLLLDDETEKYFNANHRETYSLSEKRLKDVYARQFPELERLYRAAEAKIADPEAKARLEMLGDNLTVLHWNLRQFRLLDNPQDSSFYKPDRDFYAFLKTRAGSLALAPSSAATKVAGVGEKLIVKPIEAKNGQEMTRFLLRGGQRVIVKPTGNAPVELSFSNITARGGLVKYQVYDAQGTLADQGVCTAETPVTLPAEGTDHYQFVIGGGGHTLMMKVKGAAWAVYGRTDDKGLHVLGLSTPLYFEVPTGVAKFSLWMASEPPGETAAGTLYAPDGRVVTKFKCTEKPVDLQTISVGTNDVGVWKLVPEPAEIGVTDDVWVKPGDELSGWFSLDPQAALSVVREK